MGSLLLKKKVPRYDASFLLLLNRSSQPTQALLHYLDRMHSMWSVILGDQRYSLVDQGTVALLETMAPGDANADAALIQDRMSRREIFPAIDEQYERDAILQNILGINGRILSFNTFFQDLIYLEACVNSLCFLLPSTFPGSLRDTFTGVNQVAGEIRVQTRDHGMVVWPNERGEWDQCRELGYQQLILAAMRDFPSLSQIAPRRDQGKPASVVDSPSEECRQGIANLAFNLGFETSEIRNLRAVDPTRDLASKFLSRARPPEFYDLDENLVNDIVSYIAEHLPRAARLRPLNRPPEFTTNLLSQPKDDRCNRPRHAAYKNDREYLYLDVIYNYQPTGGSHLTSLAIQRDIFVSFFSPPYTNHNFHHGSGSSDPPLDSPLEHSLSVYDSMATGHASSSEGWNGPRVSWNSCLTSSAHFDAGTETDFSFYSLESGILPSAEVDHALSSSNVDLVFYDCNKNRLAVFRNLSEQRALFDETAGSLANDGYCFVIETTGRLVICPLHELWEAVQSRRLVLVGLKRDVRKGHSGANTLRDLIGHIERHQRRETSDTSCSLM